MGGRGVQYRARDGEREYVVGKLELELKLEPFDTYLQGLAKMQNTLGDGD